MRGVDVPLADQQRVGTSDGTLESSSAPWISAANSVESARNLAQIAEHHRTEVRDLGKPTAPIGTVRAELGRPEQLGDGPNGVTALKI
jgi:hypothetical protein